MQDEWHTPLGTALTGRAASRTGGMAPPTAAVHTVQQPARAAAEAHLQGLLAAKDSEAALLRQQLQQLTADFKFNLKVQRGLGGAGFAVLWRVHSLPAAGTCPLGSRPAAHPAHSAPCTAPAAQLLEERDAKLERLEAATAGLREAGAAHNAGLAEARRQLAEKEAALRDKEAR